MSGDGSASARRDGDRAMDYIPPLAAVTAATQKANHAEELGLTTAKTAPAAVSAAPDPRSIYTLSPEAAGAVFALAETQIRAIDAMPFDPPDRRGTQIAAAAMATVTATTPVVSPETTKTIGAANRNWSEDVRLDHSPSRIVGTDTVVQYDNPRVMAAWSAAFPDVAGRKFRGAHLSDTDLRSALRQLEIDIGFHGPEREVYVLCNSAHFESISQDNPKTHFNWIDVDNDDIVVFWPKSGDEA
ncbi:hypothetical protein [Methylobacterium sp.]|uniref:hypothetical protein n=2 Tax=Methylobacterium sp. TaxID=409 RepID=UPI00257BE621|nr:hypothetical protein [Methylobacterium sp.]